MKRFLLIALTVILLLAGGLAWRVVAHEQEVKSLQGKIELGTQMDMEEGYFVDHATHFPHEKALQAAFSYEPVSTQHKLRFVVTRESEGSAQPVFEKVMEEAPTKSYSGTYFPLNNQSWGKGKYVATLFLNGKPYSSLEFVLE